MLLNNNIEDKLCASLSSSSIKDNITIWEHILESINFKFDDTNHNNNTITSTQIKKAKETWKGKKNQFEPRILCKLDNDKCRPDIFKEYGLYIISIKNGTYLLIKNNIYIKLNKINDTDIQYIKKNNNSLILSIGDSETTLIDNLRYNGIFERNDFLGEKILYGPLLGGRHRCSFDTILNNENKISIQGAQYETDGCYESENKILLIEAKSVECDDFNVRQLYFPYRTIYDKIKDKKEIIPLFIYKDKKNIIHIFKYIWNNPYKLTDVKCIDYYKFKFIN